jgi:cation diffusion facilitator CzcD-associated flavoprotein CzcO
MNDIHADISPTPLERVAGDVQHVDVLVVGAGISGISAGYYLQTQCPRKSFAILEARQVIGGTWDLFRYPGVRSDSDMYTLGYSFRPWRSEKSITDGPSVLQYVRDTASAYGIDRKIKYGHRVTRASWSTADGLWTVEAEVGPEKALTRFTCNFLYMCAGYYDYESGYTPGWPGMERFRGRVVHPQHWPEDLDYKDRRVVVIGSGATAVTLVPAMAETAAHVTMLQRSPTYVVALPARDRIARWLHRWLPARLAHGLARWKNVFLTMYFYNLTRRKPDYAKHMILKAVQKELGPDYDVSKHFTPSYNPWDQRLCLIPDADLFKAIRAGTASVVTDEIESFTETGLKLRSGASLDADIIVTATGLKVKMVGGMAIVVDGAPVDMAKQLIYRGMMLSDVPNLAFALGYTNASWTLKCELTSAYICRLVNHMQARGYDWCAPRRRDSSLTEVPAIDFSSGYIQRASAVLPKQGSKKPWRLYQNYALDMAALRFGTLDDGTMEFGRAGAARRVA